MTKSKKDKKKKSKKLPKAMRVDKYQLYQDSVQSPEVDVKFFLRAYKDQFGRLPQVLREDFCAAALICCQWVKGNKDRRAIGVDFDPQPLEWGRVNNISKLKPGAQQRVKLIEGDARGVSRVKADIVAAQNFSFFIFKTRAELLKYFVAARKNLGKQGILVLDMMGGYETFEEDHEETTKHSGYTYVWDQHRFDPITHDCKFYIHFRFKDGSALNRAFTYDWRLWTIPEVRELLAEAGFGQSHVYWEGTNPKTGEGNDVYTRRSHAPSDPAWIAYVVGVK